MTRPSIRRLAYGMLFAAPCGQIDPPRNNLSRQEPRQGAAADVQATSVSPENGRDEPFLTPAEARDNAERGFDLAVTCARRVLELRRKYPTLLGPAR